MGLDFENLALGKKEYKHDVRTLMLARYVLPDVRIPARHDFDKGRAPLPIRMMGNDSWGNCVIVTRANHLLRLERVEQRRTLPITDEDVITQYANESEAQFGTRPVSPGDEGDNGLVMLDANRSWRNSGWPLMHTTKTKSVQRNYSIAAYGELEPSDPKALRAACYLLHGIHFGVWLPRAAMRMTQNGLWDYNGETGMEWSPGSWGGHAVYSKAFDEDGFEVLTWGMKVKMTNAFIEKYVDEAWAVVDNFNNWRVRQTIDVVKLRKYLSEVSSKVDR